MRLSTAISWKILAALVSLAAGLVQVIGLFMLASWTIWCASTLVLIAVAFVSDAFECQRQVWFGPGMDVWLYTAIGEVGVLCILLSRRLAARAQHLVDGRRGTRSVGAGGPHLVKP